MAEKQICPNGCGKIWVGTSNRRAEQPLDPVAVAAADQASHSNCARLKQADGSYRQLTMSDDDYLCRRAWMDAYLAALGADSGKKKSPTSKPAAKPAPKRPPDHPVIPCEKAMLTVQVTDYDDNPIPDVKVTVDGLGSKQTDQYGMADFGEVSPGHYDATAEKDKHRPAPDQPVGPAEGGKDAPACQTTVIPLQLDPPPEILRENLIFVGSEMDYDSFWLKMMFVGAAYVAAGGGAGFRSAERKTLAFVDNGYTADEKKVIEDLKGLNGYNVVTLSSGSDIVKLINTRPETHVGGKKKIYLLQDVAFFSHGLASVIKLNYLGSPAIDFDETQLSATREDAFVPGSGKIFSFACRTGTKVDSEWFITGDSGAKIDESLAQKMADHFKAEVHAFLKRSNYGEVLREKSDSDGISAALRKGRETMDGSIIDISKEHQALPHPGLADKSGPKKEGTNGYALWRKAGGIRLPRTGDTPKGLSDGMHVFTPK
jgi:hypothetical protein